MIRSSYHESQCNYPTESELDVISITESIQKDSQDSVVWREKRKTRSFKYKTVNRNSRTSVASEISEPVDVQRQIHVYHNSETGALEGLPLSWIRAINSASQEEQSIKCLYEVYPIDKTFNDRLKRKNETLKQNTVSTYKKIKNWFWRKPENQTLSFPADFHHPVHVTKNPKTGELEGLPNEWLQALSQ